MRKLLEATFSLDGVIESRERWALPVWGKAEKDAALRQLKRIRRLSARPGHLRTIRGSLVADQRRGVWNNITTHKPSHHWIRMGNPPEARKDRTRT
jgi:hypothetical protein